MFCIESNCIVSPLAASRELLFMREPVALGAQLNRQWSVVVSTVTTDTSPARTRLSIDCVMIIRLHVLILMMMTMMMTIIIITTIIIIQ